VKGREQSGTTARATLRFYQRDHAETVRVKEEKLKLLLKAWLPELGIKIMGGKGVL